MNDNDIIKAMNTALVDANKALKSWRDWARFVFSDGAPVQGDDAELRRMICERYDSDVKAAKENR